MSIAGIVALIIFALFAARGFRKGMVRQLSGIIALVVSILLVNFLVPRVTELLRKHTPVYEWVEQGCEKTVASQVERYLKKGSDMTREQVRSLLDQNGIDSSPVDYMSDEELSGLVRDYFGDAYSFGGDAIGALDSLSRIDQTNLIRQLPLPGFVQKMMLNYNNNEGYRLLGVSDFGHYLSQFIANLIVQIAAYLVTFLLVHLIVRTILTTLKVFSRLPILRTTDRIGGLIIGLVKGLFFAWLVMMIASLLSGTPVGMTVMDAINDSPVLRLVNSFNVLLKSATDSLGSVL